MANDPAFLCYPGDILKDIQFLSDVEKGCYLNLILAQHRFICISHDLLMNITSSLCEQHKNNICSLLTKDNNSYTISWLKEAMIKRKEYSEGRARNRFGKVKEESPKKKKKNNTSKSYEPHMVNENANVIVDGLKKENEISLIFPYTTEPFMKVWDVLIKEKKWKGKSLAALQACLEELSKVSEQDAIQMMKNSIAGGWQGIFELKNNGKQSTPNTDFYADQLNRVLGKQRTKL